MEAERVDSLSGNWFMALLMIVLVGWFVFKYLVPRGWKEWRAAGIVQAFVIALYAEMYGFPLTIYVLTAYFGIDIPWLHLRGHLWSTLLGWGDVGALFEMFLGYAVLGVGLLLLAMGWKQIYTAQKDEKLVTSGAYKFVRHPQYTGIFITVLGQLIHWPTLLTLLFAPVILLMYYRLAKREEKQMITLYGQSYQEYMNHVPRFIPRLRSWKPLLNETD